MSTRRIAAGLLVVSATGLGACSAYGPGGVPYSTRGSDSAIGATTGTASGAVSGGGTTEKKEPRANTPPGMDRDGHGPATGAIVDPTGAATRGKSF